ncbi:ribonuclease [Pseudomonas sp. ABC1]|uniref:ribonuclease domain-containing protein n=1 Tax=Pseudomonas sp. ABC1 TaxID=2748080 RepID=UPI0015C364CA|nr:ribonuclease domain-containing protein [Pseudomonas sp. ABC1]QLF93674.1 ribonuclease [Pseudomonas sp. ABC1]
MRVPLLILAATACFLFWLKNSPDSQPGNTTAPYHTQLSASAQGSYEPQGRSGTAPSSRYSAPVETAPATAQQQELYKTLERIRRGGPYPYPRDGITFSNREKLLPARPRGYYREYTVDTPGLSHRGPRRVVTGGNPPVEFYYTQDHYRSFVRIRGH